MTEAWGGGVDQCTMHYPMYVIRVADFLGMCATTPHQVLLSKRLVWEHGKEVAVFVSHEWCGRAEPDPQFRQLRVLQSVFAVGASGSLRLERDLSNVFMRPLEILLQKRALAGCMTWSMWYDYFSVPQPGAEDDPSTYADISTDMGRAVASLSAYVQACRYFLVLAPSVRHEDGHMLDYTTWKARGWCRFERLALVLGSDALHILIVRREDAVAESAAHDYLMDPVGQGEFKFEEDKVRLAVVAERLLQRRLASLLAASRMADYRCLRALRMLLLDGLPVSEQLGDELEGDGGFLMRMRLESPLAEVQGTTPLLLASRAGDLCAIEACLSWGASLNCVEKVPRPAYAVRKGQSPLHAACLSGRVEAVEALLHHRAEVGLLTSERATVLHLAAIKGEPCIMRLLLEKRACIDQQSGWGVTPLGNAVILGRRSAVEFLLQARASVMFSGNVLGPLHLAAIFNSGVPIVRLLLEADADVHSRYEAKGTNIANTGIRVLGLSYRLGRRGYMRAVCYHLAGSTPLLAAVVVGALAEAETLLMARADPTMQNARGADVATLARSFGSRNPLRIGSSIDDGPPRGLSPLEAASTKITPPPSSVASSAELMT